MKTAKKQAWILAMTFAFAGVLFLLAPNSWAQQDGNGDADDLYNPPPCDYNDTFYKDNGVDPTQLQGRFGSARQFGPPARTYHFREYTVMVYDYNLLTRLHDPALGGFTAGRSGV